MDADRFDTLARGLVATVSRRRTLGTLLAGTLALVGVAPATAKRKRKKARRKRKRKQRKNGPCYPGTSCTPGPTNDNSGCDFTQAAALFNRDLQGANLSHTNLTGAQLAGADLRDADLRGACLVNTNLLDARIDATTKLEGAVFCHTLMPDGSIDDSGCDQDTACCPTADSCIENECGPNDCIRDIDRVCSILGTPCCPGMWCSNTIYSPFLTTCQSPCSSDEQCQARFGPSSRCRVDIQVCPYIGPCCSKPSDE